MSNRKPHAATEPNFGAVMGMRGCETAAECSSERPGHGLHPMQERLATVAASKWIDAIVIAVDVDGFANLAEFAGSAVHRVWHHDAFAGALTEGDPVALHAVYGVLARGEQRFSIAPA
jgi:hypothetical protein